MQPNRVSQRTCSRPPAAPSRSASAAQHRRRKTHLPKNTSSPRSSASFACAMPPSVDAELLDRATEIAIEAAKEAGEKRIIFFIEWEKGDESLDASCLFSSSSQPAPSLSLPLSTTINPNLQAPSSPRPSTRRPARPRARNRDRRTSSPRPTPPRRRRS